MKNIFKIMGLALMASSMIVACDPKDDEPTPTPEPDPQPTKMAKVTFGSNSWNAEVAEILTQYYDQYGINEYVLYETEDALPFVDLFVSAIPGTYQHEATEREGSWSGGDFIAYAWDVTGQYTDMLNIEYWDSEERIVTGQDQQGNTTYSAGWRPVSANLTVTSFDASTLTASFKLTATMYDYYSWAKDIVVNAPDADTENLVVEVKDYVFTQITSK